MNNDDADSALRAIRTLRRIFPELDPSIGYAPLQDQITYGMGGNPATGGDIGDEGRSALAHYEQRAIAVRDDYLARERREYDEKMATPVDAGPFGMLDRRRTYTVTVKRMEHSSWHGKRPALDARGNQITTTYKSLRPEWSSVKREGEVGASLLPYRGTIEWFMSSGSRRRIDIVETISITATEMPAAAKEGSK